MQTLFFLKRKRKVNSLMIQNLNITYYMLLVNDIIKDYSLNYQTAIILGQSYKRLYPTAVIQILEVKSVKIFDVV